LRSGGGWTLHACVLEGGRGGGGEREREREREERESARTSEREREGERGRERESARANERVRERERERPRNSKFFLLEFVHRAIVQGPAVWRSSVADVACLFILKVV